MYDERIGVMMDKIKTEAPEEYEWFKQTGNLPRLQSHIIDMLEQSPKSNPCSEQRNNYESS